MRENSESMMLDMFVTSCKAIMSVRLRSAVPRCALTALLLTVSVSVSASSSTTAELTNENAFLVVKNRRANLSITIVITGAYREGASWRLFRDAVDEETLVANGAIPEGGVAHTVSVDRSVAEPRMVLLVIYDSSGAPLDLRYSEVPGRGGQISALLKAHGGVIVGAVLALVSALCAVFVQERMKGVRERLSEKALFNSAVETAAHEMLAEWTAANRSYELPSVLTADGIHHSVARCKDEERAEMLDKARTVREIHTMWKAGSAGDNERSLLMNSISGQ